MIIVRLTGGLGNQLFQYAAGRALAHRRGVPLKLDLSWYADVGLRKYRLDRFRIAATIAAPEEIPRLNKLGTKFRLRWERLLPVSKRTIIVERRYGFDPRLAKASGNVYLIGYWQSERYFADIADLLRQELTLAEPPDAANAEMLRRIEESVAVSVHVRRGDYLNNPLYSGICTRDYYHAAAERIAQIVGRPHFFIFSDDMPWVMENIRFPHPTTYVTHNGEERDYEDLRLMSRCQHHIIANSSFSWWGAWLAEAREGQRGSSVVIAPSRWFNDPRRETRDLLPARWQTIPA